MRDNVQIYALMHIYITTKPGVKQIKRTWNQFIYNNFELKISMHLHKSQTKRYHSYDIITAYKSTSYNILRYMENFPMVTILVFSMDRSNRVLQTFVIDQANYKSITKYRQFIFTIYSIALSTIIHAEFEQL